MKTNLSLFVLAAFLCWMTACTDDTLNGDQSGKPHGPTVEAGKVLYGFALKDFGKGSVPLTRVGEALPASVPESKIDSLTVYVFNQDAAAPFDSTKTIFAEEFKVGDKLVADANNMTASISLSGTGKKKIYFVANAIGQKEMDQLQLGKSTEAQFLQMKTNLLTTADMLASPLIMTAIDSLEVVEKGALGGTNTDKQVELESTVAARTIVMKRIVARFDIENNAETSDLVIEDIVLNNVRPAALVNKTNNFEATDNSQYAYAADGTGTVLPLLANMEKFDFTRYPDCNTGRAQSVFYVYPDMNGGTATGGDGNKADRFYLTLYGKTQKTGAKVVYNVYMYKKSADDTKDAILIKPNNQYLIKINDLDPTRLNATITVKDWLIGDTVIYDMSDGTVAISCVEFPLTPAIDGQEGTGQMLTIPTDRALATGVASVADAANPVNVRVEAISEWQLLKGYNAEWIDTLTNIDAVKLPVGTLSKVLPKQANPYDKDRRGTLVFRNVQRPSIMQTLIVVQKAGAAANVKIGKYAAANAAYAVYNRDATGTNQVAETEKSDTLLLATTAAPFTNAAYTDIELTVTGADVAAHPEYYQEWGVRVDRIDTTWISVTQQPGLNRKGAGITFSLAQNDSVQRKGIIRIYDRQDAAIYRDLVIVQDGAEVTGALVKVADRTGDGFTDLADMGPSQLTGTIAFPQNDCTGADLAPYSIKLTTKGNWSIQDVAGTTNFNWLDAYSLNKKNERVMSGTGDAVIQVGTTANDSAIVRTGKVEITIGETLYTIDITKAAKDPAITLDDIHVTGNHIDFAATGDVDQVVKFISNDRWTITAKVNGADGAATGTDATWLKFYNTKSATPDAAITAGAGSTLLKIAADVQTATGVDAPARSATVTITCESGTKPTLVLTVYQAGLKKP